MEVVTGATGSVLTKVGALLQEEYLRQKGVKKDVESLQKELFFMRAALYKVAEVPPEQLDEQVKAWASNVKALSYDMEDAVDTFTVRVTASKDHGRARTVGMRIVGIGKVRRYQARTKLAGVIADMKDLTMQVAELRDRYKLDDTHVTNTKEQVQEVKDVISRNFELWTWWRQHMSFRIQEVWEGWRSRGIGFILAANSSRDILPPCLINRVNGFLGTHDEMRKLTEWVRNGVSKCGVLYIVGDVGVGKTTLARDLYHKCCHLFAGRAIIKMSSRPSDDKIISDGLDSQETWKKIEGIKDIWQESRHLVLNYGIDPEETLKKIQGIKDRWLKSRHLVLIDGVDSEETWKETENVLFPILEGKKEDGLLHAGNKIIVTTRLPEVPSSLREQDLTHRQALGNKEVKHIFMAALRESTRGGQMINHCHIPPRVWEMCVDHRMAVIVMAGYAACNPHMSPDEWKQVCNKLLPDSVKALTRNGVSRILSHCYHDMSAEIKTCSLYLSMYPKGSRVSRKHLARRWMAEGFVVNKPGQSMEQVADDYFDQLVRRKMVRAVQRSNTGKVKDCEVDDLVYEFIVSKASEENLVTVHKQGLPPAPPSASGRVRRLSFSVHKTDAPVEQKMNVGLSMSHVRSLALFVPDGEKSGSEEDLCSLLRDSPIIQVLDLEGWQSVKVTKQDMEEICNMFLLKYLSLRGTKTGVNKLIGSDIVRLHNLETLDVRETQIIELPGTIWELQRLVNIFGGDKKKRKGLKLQAPSGTATPSKKTLRVISGIEFTTELAKHLNDQTYLMKLAIYKVDTKPQESMLQSLQCRRCLQSLLIMDDVGDLSASLGASIDGSSFKSLAALDISGKLGIFPKWITKLEALTQLNLPITVFKADHLVLNELAGLKNLISLTFSESPESLRSPGKKEIIVRTRGFAHLNLLQFIAKTLPPMSFLDNAMPSLAQIHLRFTTFEGLHGIHNLHKLQEVHIHVDIGESQEFTKSMIDNLVEATREHANVSQSRSSHTRCETLVPPRPREEARTSL